MEQNILHGQVCLVTGGAQGIGWSVYAKSLEHLILPKGHTVPEVGAGAAPGRCEERSDNTCPEPPVRGESDFQA